MTPTVVQPAAHPQEPTLPVTEAKRKIGMFGIFGIQNLGNECTLQAIHYNSRERLGGAAEFFAISFKADDTVQRHQLSSVPVTLQNFENVGSGSLAKLGRILFRRIPGEIRDWISAVKSLRGTDIVFMTGTGMLTDYSTSALGFPYHVFLWTLAAKLAGCKVCFVSVGVGPLYQRLSRLLIRGALTLADFRSFRDEFSKNRIAKSCFDSSRDHVYPDLAWSLPPSMFPRRTPRKKGMRIGLGMMDHYDIHLANSTQHEQEYRVYLGKMADFVEWLVSRNYEVRILQGDARHDCRVRADLKTLLESRGMRYDHAPVHDEGASTVDELLGQIAQVDLVVSPRFHNLLLGLMMEIPAISISYDPKSDSLLEGVGLGKYHQKMSELDVEKLKTQLLDLEAELESVKPAIRKKAADYRRQLDEQYGALLALFESHCGTYHTFLSEKN
jgi:polysaccharide pyruvyl transferase WcaK-like protein